MADKKATEILAELQQETFAIKGYIKNLDSLNKIMLGRLNEAIMKLNSLSPQPNVPQIPPRAPMVEAVELPVSESPLKEIAKTNRRTNKIQAEPTNRTDVTQLVQYDNGTPIILAEIKILDFQGNLILKTRTNTKGQWQAPLDAGKYSIHLTKSGKKPVESKYQIDVPVSKRHELPPLLLAQ